jgi:hypothetical protein
MAYTSQFYLCRTLKSSAHHVSHHSVGIRGADGEKNTIRQHVRKKKFLSTVNYTTKYNVATISPH